MGEDELLGIGAPVALGEFFQFYRQLNKEERSKIPEEVMVEITKLAHCIEHDEDLEIKGKSKKYLRKDISNIDTCLSSRRSQLMSSILIIYIFYI